MNSRVIFTALKMLTPVWKHEYNGSSSATRNKFRDLYRDRLPFFPINMHDVQKEYAGLAVVNAKT